MTAASSFAILAERVAPGAKLTRRWTLKGGVSASVEALEFILVGGTIRRVVVRCPGAAEWKPIHPDVTSMEFALLKVLRDAGMAVPEPYFCDLSREVLPSPYLVMEFVDGTTTVGPADLSDALRKMAIYLVRLHALDPERLELPRLPASDDPVEGVLRYLPSTLDTDRLRAVLAAGGPGGKPNGPAILHGDFWPENILWKGRSIAAVVDWEDAAIGEPLSDLAGCRIELFWRYGEEAMEAFTGHYRSLAPIDWTALPIWELYVSLAASLLHGELGPRPSDRGGATRENSDLHGAGTPAGAVAWVTDPVDGSHRGGCLDGPGGADDGRSD